MTKIDLLVIGLSVVAVLVSLWFYLDTRRILREIERRGKK